MGGIAVQYGTDLPTARQELGRAVREDAAASPETGITRFLAVHDAPGETAAKGVVGAVTLERGIRLRSMRWSVAPRFAPRGLLGRILAADHPFEGGEARVSAWRKARFSERLEGDSAALGELYDKAKSFAQENELLWTVEPTNLVVAYARVALEYAGFKAIGQPLIRCRRESRGSASRKPATCVRTAARGIDRK